MYTQVHTSTHKYTRGVEQYLEVAILHVQRAVPVVLAVQEVPDVAPAVLGLVCALAVKATRTVAAVVLSE
jgi:hypothetical protein